MNAFAKEVARVKELRARSRPSPPIRDAERRAISAQHVAEPGPGLAKVFVI